MFGAVGVNHTSACGRRVCIRNFPERFTAGSDFILAVAFEYIYKIVFQCHIFSFLIHNFLTSLQGNGVEYGY
ncbi:unknown [Bacteroides sp. CAG:633]|nr:unknown [Bacteroides sp. CAG:633]